MRYTEDELQERAHPAPIEAVRNDHPWGLCINLSERELKLLGIDKEDACAVGDLIHLGVMAKVTHCSDSENERPLRRDAHRRDAALGRREQGR